MELKKFSIVNFRPVEFEQSFIHQSSVVILSFFIIYFILKSFNSRLPYLLPDQILADSSPVHNSVIVKNYFKNDGILHICNNLKFTIFSGKTLKL
jgi:hypothetical protein